MKLSKRIVTTWIKSVDYGKGKIVNKEVERVVEFRITSARLNLGNITLHTILKILCIFLKCNQNCNNCLLKSEDMFKAYLEEKGVVNGK